MAANKNNLPAPIAGFFGHDNAVAPRWIAPPRSFHNYVKGYVKGWDVNRQNKDR